MKLKNMKQLTNIIVNMENNFAVRYCASYNSIPLEAYEILPIYINGSTFNENTGIEYGFSYKIKNEYDIAPLCKLEKDILMEKFTNTKFEYYNTDKYDCYENFISYYDDEDFSNLEYDMCDV